MRLLYLEKGKSLYAKGDTCSFYDHGDVKLPVTNKTTVSQLKKTNLRNSTGSSLQLLDVKTRYKRESSWFLESGRYS